MVLHKSSGANLGTEKDITKLAGKVAIVTGTSKKTFLKIDALRPVYSTTKRANVCARREFEKQVTGMTPVVQPGALTFRRIFQINRRIRT